jgi:phosphoglycolate phosphatase-like HAD superfamily hydrolase
MADTLLILVKIAGELGREHGISNISQVTEDFIRHNSIGKILTLFKIPIWQLPSIIMRGQRLLNERMPEVRIFPGMSDVFIKLRELDFTLGILSSNSEKNIQHFLQQNQLDMFSFIHTEKNIFGKDKALLHLLVNQSLDKEQVLYVGDETRDVEACKKAKIQVIAVTWGFNSRELLEEVRPDYIAEKPIDILEYINKQ